jgi:hypothetical protein
MSAGWLLSCSLFSGTPMRTRKNCRYVPSVEDCQAVADRIEDLCLRDCVLHLCRVGEVVCDTKTKLKCARRKTEEKIGNEVGGWVPDDVPRTCKVPKEEVNWCELPRSPPCQSQMMVHEYAHACGWHHKQGKGVPGDKGKFNCL